MRGRVDVGTFLAGLLLAVAGGALLAEGLGWWELRLGDLRYMGPIALIVVGAAIFLTAFTRRRDEG